jgi:hypothetical protein
MERLVIKLKYLFKIKKIKIMTKIKNIVLTLVTLLISVTAITAAPVNPANSFSGDEPFTVTYVGNEGDYLVFQVVVNSDNTKNTSFKISDKAEGEIYSANIRSDNKVQTMKIEKRDNQELDFKLVIGKEIFSKSFAVLTTVQLETK